MTNQKKHEARLAGLESDFNNLVSQYRVSRDGGYVDTALRMLKDQISDSIGGWVHSQNTARRGAVGGQIQGSADAVYLGHAELLDAAMKKLHKYVTDEVAKDPKKKFMLAELTAKAVEGAREANNLGY